MKATIVSCTPTKNGVHCSVVDIEITKKSFGKDITSNVRATLFTKEAIEEGTVEENLTGFSLVPSKDDGLARLIPTL